MYWNEIPNTLPQEEWKRIEYPIMVENTSSNVTENTSISYKIHHALSNHCKFY